MSNEKEIKESENKEIEVYAERAESDKAEIEVEDVRAAALAYARYLQEKGLKPGDATFAEPGDLGIDIREDPEAEGKKAVAQEKAVKRAFRKSLKKVKIKPYEKSSKGIGFLSSAIEVRDKAQNKIDETLTNTGKEIAVTAHKIVSTYKHTRRSIGRALLAIGAVSAAILIIFDSFTVYEYAYNGKVLGYVKEQEEVTDVLEVAGTKLTENNKGSAEIEFVANRNVTFNLVDRSGKTLDDADSAVNKLVYMTDIETEAYGIYDGDSLVALVKSSNDAENLLIETMNELSRPDDGMELVSAEFANPLDIRPINVLLTSVQDNATARDQMINGGSMEVYHIIEEGESVSSIAEAFGTDVANIFDESNTETAVDPEQGDKVCVHTSVDPVSVKMVETGRMRETIEFETIKQDSDDYYKGDTYVEQEGVDGIQIFEGTITKEAGEVVDRNETRIETIREKQDKIILVGTAERPKTAPTGVFAMPIERYTLSSRFGYRWGRLHSGLDMAAPTGTPIYASDGGTVIRASYYGGYGNCIEVDHENGRVTRYAHCSKILVNVGDKVYQGENIGLVGNTGNSFGSHLHFEIILNGSATDPAPILGID